MALAGCPDFFLRHPNYQESMDRTSSRRTEELIVPGFQRSANQNLPHHHEDDVDLEQLVNDMNSSMESVYSTQSDTALLLNNSHAPAPHHHHHHMHPAFPRHSQPMHIQAVRCLQEEHRLRPASLPAIPNPFPELCSPAGSPVLSPIQTPNNHLTGLLCSGPHTHIQSDRHVFLWTEVSHVSRMLQTSVAELGIRMGTSAGRISLNLLNPSAVSGKTGAHFRFTRFNLGS